MPATLFSDLEFSTNGHHGNKVIEDTRALQVALELSMLYMNGDRQQQHKSDASSAGQTMVVDSSASSSSSPLVQQNYIPNGFPEEPRNKKSQNMTECVPVPSSEHVAEIVGRQGKFIYFFIAIFYVSVVARALGRFYFGNRPESSTGIPTTGRRRPLLSVFRSSGIFCYDFSTPHTRVNPCFCYDDYYYYYCRLREIFDPPSSSSPYICVYMVVDALCGRARYYYIFVS